MILHDGGPDSTLTLSNTLRAYRQAKTALMEERSGINAAMLADFETDIETNIGKLHESLITGTARASDEVIGYPKRNIAGILDIQVQIKQSITSAVADIYWLWRYGDALESLLSDSCTSNRLKKTNDRINPRARHIYLPWSPAYREFHAAIRRSASLVLKAGKSCTIMTFDVVNYYGTIDLSFLIQDAFAQRLRAQARTIGVNVDLASYLGDTAALLTRYRTFQERASVQFGVDRNRNGLPIGAIAARLIANIALSELDVHVPRRNQSVLHYARWVDDIVVIVSGSRRSRAGTQPDALLPLAGPGRLDADRLLRPGSTFALHDGKARQFFLRGAEGQDLLSALANEIEAVGSYGGAFGAGLSRREQRDDLLEIVRGEKGGAESSLQYMDGIKVRRAAAATLIAKSVEAASLNFGGPPLEHQIALSALARALAKERDWTGFFDLMVRALSAATVGRDQRLVRTILKTLQRWTSRVSKIARCRVEGKDVPTSARAFVASYLRERIFAALAAAIQINERAEGGIELPVDEELLRRAGLDWSLVRASALRFQSADLRLFDREDDHEWSPLPATIHETSITGLDDALRAEISRIDEFRAVSSGLGERLYAAGSLSLWLARHPPSVFDIAWRWARGVPADPVPPIEVVNAVRGTAYPDALVRYTSKDDRAELVPLVEAEPRPKIRVALGNILTKVDDFKLALNGTPNRSATRVLPIVEAVAAVRRLRNPGEHLLLVLPELSTPRTTLRKLVRALLAEEIGLVAGLEYRRDGVHVANEVVAVVPRRFGASAVALWRKVLPAVGDESEALGAAQVSYGPALRDAGALVLDSQYGAIGVLVCSELLEIAARARLIGRVDTILVPSWNRDTTSFEQVIQGAALDIHCFIGVANNAEFSDSRLRGPLDIAPLRDLCRIIERDRNSVVSSVVDVDGLRAFQRGKPGKEYKPLPPGFKYVRPRTPADELEEFLSLF